MTIQPISSFSVSQLSAVKKPKSGKSNQTNPVKQDTFTPSNKELSLDEQLNVLSRMKDNNGKTDNFVGFFVKKTLNSAFQYLQ